MNLLPQFSSLSRKPLIRRLGQNFSFFPPAILRHNSTTKQGSSNENVSPRKKKKTSSISDDMNKKQKITNRNNNNNNNKQLITTTEVSTRGGVKWLDIAGRTHAWADDSFHREGDFLAYAMEALRTLHLPPDMISKVSQNLRPMPFVRVEETWACLTLRCARQNPRWLSSLLHEKVKDFRRAVSYAKRGSTFLQKKDFNEVVLEDEVDNDIGVISDLDEVRVRRGRLRAMMQSQRQNLNSTHPSMTELTDRLHIFLLKETIPLNGEGGEDGVLGGVQSSNARQDINTNPICVTTAMHSIGNNRGVIIKGDNKENNNNNINKNKNKNKKVLDKNSTVRWRIVTVHRYRVTFIEEMLMHWGSSKFRKETWIGLVRRLVHGTTMSVQSVDYKYAERLDEVETVLFQSATELSELSKVITQVHVVHRRANIHANILRETQRCYLKLLNSLNLPIESADQRELLYLSSALSLAEELHEQSRSLLALQFSLAAYMLEDHLRMLTLFTTFFIPLELITSWFGTNFLALESFMKDPWGMYIGGILLVLTAIITNVWMRGHVISRH